MKDESKIFARALAEAVEGKEKDRQESVVRNFLRVIARRKKTHLLPRILKEMSAIDKEKEVELFFAREPDNETIKKVSLAIEKEAGPGRRFVVRTDSSIMGGFKAKANNFLIDSSIKAIIEKIRQKLI